MRHRIACSLVCLGALAATAGAHAACAVAEPALLGAWRATGDTGAFEQFELARDDGTRVFRSWLHERPDVAGAAWRYDAAACRLRIDAVDSPSGDYHVAIDRRGDLLLSEPGAADPPARYRRIPD